MKRLCKRLACLLISLLLAGQYFAALAAQAAQPSKPSIPKLLLVGNSFSVDSMHYLNSVLLKEGVTEFTLGYLYRGGCSLAMHAKYAKNDSKSYTYYKSTGDHWDKTPEYTFLNALKDEAWDVIYLQQQSYNAAIASSYNSDLDYLINYMNTNKTNPKATFGWHMTWSYAPGFVNETKRSNHKDFAETFGGDPVAMYRSITAAVQEKISPRIFTAGVVPTGTAIQNARTSFFGDTLNRDNMHLSNMGRVIASYTWLAHLTGKPVEAVHLDPPELGLTDADREVIRESVNNAIAHPYEITQSKYLAPRTVTVTGGAAQVDGQSVSTATGGQQVTISFSLPAEMQFTNWTVKSGAVTLTDPNSATTTFTMPDEDVEIAAEYVNNCPSKGFEDVSPFRWYHEAVDYVVSHGIMGGYSAAKFGPDDTLNRAMIVQILYNYEKKPEVTAENRFPDVAASEWYYNAVRWGANRGVVSGYGSGKFAPNDDVTLEQVGVILWNYAGKPHAESDLDSVGTYNDWAAEALSWCEATGILKNIPITRAIDPATRAQTAQMLVNYLNAKN